MTRTFLLIAAVLLLSPITAWGIEKVSIRREGKMLKLEGKAVQEDQGGGIMLLAPDGVIWNIAAAEVVDRKSDDRPFKPLSRQDLAAQALSLMPADSKVHHTEHYLICYNTSDGYAQWCGALYERFYAAFHKYWNELGWKLHEPEMPLVALVFDDKKSYSEFARSEVKGRADSMVAYYNFGTNRVAMYDLTGKGKAGPPADDVHTFFSGKGATFNVATVVHEAAHQLTFNCGLHQRYADLPLWVLEGLPVYFETPDLRKADDEWKTIGEPSRIRLGAYRKAVGKERQNAGGLERLLTDDKRFTAESTYRAAYGEGWAFNHFLFNEKKAEYVEYLRVLAAKEPGIIDQPGQRLETFKAIFGKDLKKLDTQFLKYMTTVTAKQ